MHACVCVHACSFCAFVVCIHNLPYARLSFSLPSFLLFPLLARLKDPAAIKSEVVTMMVGVCVCAPVRGGGSTTDHNRVRVREPLHHATHAMHHVSCTATSTFHLSSATTTPSRIWWGWWWRRWQQMVAMTIVISTCLTEATVVTSMMRRGGEERGGERGGHYVNICGGGGKCMVVRWWAAASGDAQIVVVCDPSCFPLPPTTNSAWEARSRRFLCRMKR